MAFAIASVHTKTLVAPSTGTADKVYGKDYVSLNSHSVSVSGADVGGIPYCPTAKTIVTSSGFVFNASGVAGDGLAINAGTAASAVSALSITQTWNNAAVNFTANKTNITNTASGASSLIEDWQVDSVSKMAVTKAGMLVLAAAGDGIRNEVGADNRNGIWFYSGSQFVGINGSTGDYATHIFAGFELRQSMVGSLVWMNGNDVATSSSDLCIGRISAGVIGVGTGAAGSFAGRLKNTSTIMAGVAVGSLNASPTTGEVQTVTDALSPVAGSAVAAGGSAKAIVWWNGSQWTVIGV